MDSGSRRHRVYFTFPRVLHGMLLGCKMCFDIHDAHTTPDWRSWPGESNQELRLSPPSQTLECRSYTCSQSGVFLLDLAQLRQYVAVKVADTTASTEWDEAWTGLNFR